MESYDVIIVGAGIAGTGLAYNLSQVCAEKSVLIVDKKGIGANVGYGYRIIFRETIDKYKLPYFHKYKYFNVGAYDKIYFKVFHDVYFVDYNHICKNLFQRSKTDFRKENALSIDKNILRTNIQDYKFKYLIDCSGSDFFLGRIIKRPLPYIYWINSSRIITSDNKINDDSFYYFFSDSGYFEEIYPLKNKIIHADWMYTTKPNFNLIKPHNKTFSKKIKMKGKIEKEMESIIPVSPVLPIVIRNYAFVGDSFGNADPNVGGGIKPTLESSRILAHAIKKENLELYEKEWKRIFLDRYIRCIASKLDRYHCSPLAKKIKNYPPLSKVVKIMGRNPNIFLSMLKSEEKIDISKELKPILPKIQMISLAYYYSLLKLKYIFMEFSVSCKQSLREPGLFSFLSS